MTLDPATMTTAQLRAVLRQVIRDMGGLATVPELADKTGLRSRRVSTLLRGDKQARVVEPGGGANRHSGRAAIWGLR